MSRAARLRVKSWVRKDRSGPEIKAEAKRSGAARGLGDLEDQEPAAGFEDPPELEKGFLQAGDMAQGVTHGQEIEGVGGQRHPFGAGLDEMGGKLPPRDREHARARIQAGDIGGGAEDFGGFSRDQAGAARDIEQAIARLQAMLLQGAPAVRGPAVQKPPVDHGIVVPGAGVEELVDEGGLLLGAGVMRGQRRVGNHAIALGQMKVDGQPNQSGRMASRWNGLSPSRWFEKPGVFTQLNPTARWGQRAPPQGRFSPTPRRVLTWS